MSDSGSSFSARMKRRRQVGSHSAERQRRLRRKARTVSPVPPKLAEFLTPENLVDRFDRSAREAGQGAGPDGVTPPMLSRREVWGIFRLLSVMLLAGINVASAIRRVRIPKRTGGHRTISIRSIVARVVEAALNDAMAPFWEGIFSEQSYGFRPGRGVWDVFVALEMAVSQGYTVIAQDDVYHAFDELPIEGIMAAHRQYIHDEQLLSFIEMTLRGIEDPHRAKGIGQGGPYSPSSMNVLLHAVLDTQVSQQADDPLQFRYADNIAYMGRSVPDGRDAISHAQELLHAADLRLKGEDGHPVELAGGGEVRILGLVLSLADGRVQYGLDEDCWDNLRMGLRKAHTKDSPSMVALQVVQGWIGAIAPAVESCCMEDLTEQVLKIAARAGFREVSREHVLRWIQGAADRWLAFRERQGHTAVSTGEAGSAASPTAAEPLVGCDQPLVIISELNSADAEFMDAGSADVVSADSGCPFLAPGVPGILSNAVENLPAGR